jgi:uncharacterized protein YdaT
MQRDRALAVLGGTKEGSRMSWSFDQYPTSMENLRPTIVREKAILIANALLEEGYAEDHCIGIAIARAKEWAERRGLVETDASGC